MLTLSSKGLSNFANINFSNDFKIIFKNNIYEINKFHAIFISPQISNILSLDFTVSEFYMSINDEKNQFEFIIQLINGNNIEITDDNISFLIQCSKILGNNELINNIFDIKFPTINENNCIEILNLKLINGGDISKEIIYLSNNIIKFEINEFLKLDILILEQIFFNKFLNLPDEDFLFNIILNLITINQEKYKKLLYCIKCEYLSTKFFKKFLNLIEELKIINDFWEKLRLRLINSKKIELFNDENRFNMKKIPILFE